MTIHPQTGRPVFFPRSLKGFRDRALFWLYFRGLLDVPESHTFTQGRLSWPPRPQYQGHRIRPLWLLSRFYRQEPRA